jgi:S-ribosylhomocysteine lyase LuxS involved in autoinducer biosynthesis
MNDVDAEQIREALARVYKQAFPLKSKEDIVGLNEVQCGNPGLFAVVSTNDAMAQYMRCLYTKEQAEAAGIGSIYNCAW